MAELVTEKKPRRFSRSEEAKKVDQHRRYQPMAKRAAQVVALSKPAPEGPGLTIAQIAKRMRISPRYVSMLRRVGKSLGNDDTGLIYVPEPIAEHALSPEALATVKAGKSWLWWVREHPGITPPDHYIEAAANAFEAFYVRYKRLYFPEHWRRWVRAALANERLLLNVPPRHAKSTLFSQWWPIWLICLDRNIQILIVSETMAIAKKMSRAIAWNLEQNPRLIPEHGRFRPDNEVATWKPLSGELLVHGRDRLAESEDLTVQIRGAGQQILGMEADFIVGDDAAGPKATATEAGRESLSEYWHGDVMSRLAPSARVVVIGQRIHYRDLYGELAEAKNEYTGKAVYHHIVQPAVISWPGKDDEGNDIPPVVLWERQEPFERLMTHKADVTRRQGTALWETRYQQNPLPPSGVTVQLAWIEGDATHRGCLDRDRRVGQPATLQRLLGIDDDLEIPPALLERTKLVRVMSLDPPQERAGGLVIMDIVQDREVLTAAILEVHRLERGIQAVHALIRQRAGLYNPDYLIIETNAAQRWFFEDPGFVEWRRHSNIRALSHATGMNKQDPDYGMESLSVDFEMGRIRLPYGDADSRAMSNMLIDEVTHHPYADYDDIFAALWYPKFNLPKLTFTHRYSARDPRDPTPTFHSPPRLRKGWKAFARGS